MRLIINIFTINLYVAWIYFLYVVISVFAFIGALNYTLEWMLNSISHHRIE